MSCSPSPLCASRMGRGAHLARGGRLRGPSSTVYAVGDAWRSALYTGVWEASMEEDFLVEEAMNPHVVTLKEGSTVRNATHEFIKHNISGAPVVGADGQIKGVLCKSDLTVPFKGPSGKDVKIYAMHIPFLENKSTELLAAFETVLDQPVDTYMERNPSTVPPTLTISRALSLMVGGRVNRLPVVEDGEVVGILTRYDVLKALARLSAVDNVDASLL